MIWRALFNARMRNYLLTGILVTAPITITVWLSWQILQFFDRTVRRMMPPDLYPDISIPGLGLLVVFLGLILGALVCQRTDQGRSAPQAGSRTRQCVLANNPKPDLRIPVIRAESGCAGHEHDD